MERYRRALLLAGEKQSIRSMTPDGFSLLPSREYGIAHASMAVMNNSGILSILRKNVGVYSHILNFMIIARLQEPSSDLSLINMSEKIYYPWSGNIGNYNLRNNQNSLAIESYTCPSSIRNHHMIRSESEQVLNLLNMMNIPYPEKITDGARKK